MKGLRSTAFAAIATLGTLSVPPLMAQTDGPAYVRHVMTTVKPERVAEFESLLEERAATLRESGQQGFRNVYESVQGDLYTYLIEDPVPSIATLDEPPAAMPSLDWTRRVQEAVTAQRSVNNFAETLTPAERGQMFSRGSSVLSFAEDSFFRFRPDLSFASD